MIKYRELQRGDILRVVKERPNWDELKQDQLVRVAVPGDSSTTVETLAGEKVRLLCDQGACRLETTGWRDTETIIHIPSEPAPDTADEEPSKAEDLKVNLETDLD